MDVEKAMNQRHSVRYYNDKKISQKDLVDIVRLAQQSPSWANSQAGHAYIATGQTLSRLRQAFGDWNSQSHPTDPIIPMLPRHEWPDRARNNMKNWMTGVQNDLGTQWDNLIFDAENVLYNAPAVVYLTLPKGYSEWSIYDLGLFSDSLVLAAKDKGIDSLIAYQFIKYPELVHQYLSIKQDEDVIIGIGLGFEDTKAPINKITSNREEISEKLTILD